MGSKRDRQLRAASASVVGAPSVRLVAASAHIDTDKEHPVFCFHYLDKGEFGLRSFDALDYKAFVEKLSLLSGMTWAQIKSAPRHGLGSEFIDLGCIRRPKPDFLGEDTTRLMAFRFNGKAPMVGHRVGRVFHICFLDPKFKLYSHG